MNRARVCRVTLIYNYFPKIEIYSSLVGKVTGLSRLLRLGLPPCFQVARARGVTGVEVREGPHRFAYRTTVPRHPGCRRTRTELYYEVAVRLGPHFASQPPRRGLAAAQQLFKLTSILCG